MAHRQLYNRAASYLALLLAPCLFGQGADTHPNVLTFIPARDSTGAFVSTGIAQWQDQNALVVGLRAPNSVAATTILSATAANPMVLTLVSNAPNAAATRVFISGATGTGCSGMNGFQTVSSITGASVTITFNGTGCTYSASTGTASFDQLWKLPTEDSAGCIQSDGNGNLSFTSSCTGGGGSLPVSDSTVITYNASDNTKKWQVSNALIPTATTVVTKIPGSVTTFTMAGLEVANVFTANQTLNNSVVLQSKDLSSNLIPLLYMDAFNNVNVGVVATPASNGDLFLWSKGTSQVEIDVSGYMFPVTNAAQFIGTSGHAWGSGYIDQLTMGDASLVASINMQSQNHNGNYAEILSGANVSSTWQMYLPNTIGTIGQTLVINSLPFSYAAQLSWQTSCAGDCMTTDTAQTVTGTKTFSVTQLFNNNVFLQWYDTSASARQVLVMDGLNNIDVGGISSPGGAGGLNMWAGGTEYMNLSPTGELAPLSNNGVSLGDGTHNFSSISVGQVLMGDSAVPSLVSWQSQNFNGNFASIFGGSNISSTYQIYLPNSIGTIGQVLVINSLPFSYAAQLSWQTGCAGDCMTTDTNQTVTGTKTFAVNQGFNNNVFEFWKDTAGTFQQIMGLDTSNNLDIGTITVPTTNGNVFIWADGNQYIELAANGSFTDSVPGGLRTAFQVVNTLTSSVVWRVSGLGNETANLVNSATGYQANGAASIDASNNATFLSLKVNSSWGLTSAGVLTVSSCTGCGGGGGVSSLNSLTGALSIAGTTNEIGVAPSGTTITLSTPQPICTSCAVTFAAITAQGNVIPSSSTTYNLGGASNFWNNFYTVNAFMTGNLTVNTIIPEVSLGNQIRLQGNLIPFSGTWNIGTSGSPWANTYSSAYFAGSTAGVSCSGINALTYASINGITTHC